MTLVPLDQDQQDQELVPEPAGDPRGDLQWGQQSESGVRAAGIQLHSWVRHAPAERAPFLVIPGFFVAAEIMHLAGLSPVFAGAGTVAATGLAFGLGERRQRRQDGAEDLDLEPGQDEDDAELGVDELADDPGGIVEVPAAYRQPHPRIRGIELGAATLGTGAWVTLATHWGAAGGPDHVTGLLYGAGAIGGYWWLRMHEAVRAARARREAAAAAAGEAARREAEWMAKRAEWQHLRGLVGLGGSHLMRCEATRNGELWTIDTREAGKLASRLDYRSLAELIAGYTGRELGSVECSRHPKQPFRFHIRWRERDPWAGGTDAGKIWHPWASGQFSPSAPYAELVPPVRSIKNPVVFGADPETGTPLQVPLWDSEGAKRIALIGTSGSGKSTLLDTLREGITACEDAQLIQINLAKAVEESWWAPLAAASAVGSSAEEAARAQAILDFAYGSFDLRKNAPRRRAGAREHEPTPQEPLFVIMIDETDAVIDDPYRRQMLEKIASKCRSEGWALIVASQRGVRGWISPSLRTNLSHLIFGKLRPSELRALAGGDNIRLPDMTGYGQGNAGIFGVCEHPTYEGMPFLRGRTFFWGKPATGLVSLVQARAATRQPYHLEPALLPLADQWSAITGAVPMETIMASDERYDIATTRDGSTVPGMAGVRARLNKTAASLGLATTSPALPAPADQDTPPPAADPQDQAAGRDLPETAHQERLWQLVTQPGGTTMRRAEADPGLPYSHPTIGRQLRRWRERGLVELKGSGAAEHWEPTEAGRNWRPGGRPPLRVVPDPPQPGTPQAPAQTAVSGAAPPEDPPPPGSAPVAAEQPLTHGQAVLAAAIWGLQSGSPGEGVDLGRAAEAARSAGLPADAVAEAAKLLRGHLPYVVSQAVRIMTAPGAPLPSWLAPWVPAATGGEDQDPDEDGELGEDVTGSVKP